MEIFSRLSFILLICVVSLVRTNGVGGNFISKFLSWFSLERTSNTDCKLNSSKILPLETTTKPPIKASTCPDATTISPCTCTKTSDGIQIWCDGSAVDQASVENSFKELRRVNEIPEDRGVDIREFSLSATELTQFDLAPLYGSRIYELSIDYNGNLTKLVSSGAGNSQDQFIGSIHVDRFYLSSSPFPLNGDEFGDTLKYFSNEMSWFSASYLILNQNQNNNNNPDEFEFLPGLSAFVNLSGLGMNSCNISGRLTSSHFKAFPNLQSIYLEDNKIDEIGENVFHSNVLQIDLRGNKLNETSFHPNSGIAQNGSGKELDLEYNQFTTLSSQIFHTFLSAHPKNSVNLRGNPLICNERLSWIKSRREEFQYRVWNADCINDPGRTIFNSNLIP